MQWRHREVHELKSPRTRRIYQIHAYGIGVAWMNFRLAWGWLLSEANEFSEEST